MTKGPYDAKDDYPHENSYGYQKWLSEQKTPQGNGSWKQARIRDNE